MTSKRLEMLCTVDVYTYRYLVTDHALNKVMDHVAFRSALMLIPRTGKSSIVALTAGSKYG